MAYLNSLEKIPFMGDMVKDIRFHAGTSMATIYFSSGKKIIVNINDEGIYCRKDYFKDSQESIERSIRELKIDSILK